MQLTMPLCRGHWSDLPDRLHPRGERLVSIGSYQARALPSFWKASQFRRIWLLPQIAKSTLLLPGTSRERHLRCARSKHAPVHGESCLDQTAGSSRQCLRMNRTRREASFQRASGSGSPLFLEKTWPRPPASGRVFRGSPWFAHRLARPHQTRTKSVLFARSGSSHKM